MNCHNAIEDAMLMFDKQTNRHRGEYSNKTLYCFQKFVHILLSGMCDENIDGEHDDRINLICNKMFHA
ncbi:CLUMA_CG009575, isoform A [Clunio marinus]|uniref:CLUMA_CG009575, isoform A n=1 Tax=Clunio marinus TaxID=568069 RepID=A0A1J1ICH9_9DIPT|nr:CLUMA_CG009575, isoform A [Clunio marinus]